LKKIFLLFCVLFLAQTAFAEQTVKIGFLGPLTGRFASVGIQSRQVLELLASDINQRNALTPYKVEIIAAHEGNNEKEAREAAARLVARGVFAVIGPHLSDQTKAVQGIFHEAAVIQISYGSTAVSLTRKGLPYFFRTCPPDDEQAKAFVRIVRLLNFKRVALLSDSSLYGKELASSIDNSLHSWMIDTVYKGSLPAEKTDYSEELKKIQATAPDMIFFAGYYPEAAKLLLAKQQLSWKIPLMGGDGVNHPELVEIAGIKAATGFHFLSPPNPEHLESPQTKAFLDRFQNAYQGHLSSVYPLLAGNAFLAVTESIAMLKKAQAQDVADYLHKRYFNKSGLTGEIYFNAWGDVVNDLYAVYFVNEEGRFVVKKQIRHGDFVQKTILNEKN